jgi:hypothetical protein
MFGAYALAVPICAASLPLGAALLALSGRRRWCWLEPAVGFGAALTVTGALERAPGHDFTAGLGLALMLLLAVALLVRRPYEAQFAWRDGLPVAIGVLAVLSIPFAAGDGSAPLRDGFSGSMGLAIVVLSGLSTLGAIGHLGPARRTIGAVIVALPYLVASYVVRGATEETALALFVLATAVALLQIDRRRNAGAPVWDDGDLRAGSRPWLRRTLPVLAVLGGAFSAYGFAGLLWPLAIAGRWSLNLPATRRALRQKPALRPLFRPEALAAFAGLAALAILAAAVGPHGFAPGVGDAGSGEIHDRVSAIGALGVWPTSSYRLDAPGGAHLTGLAVALAILTLTVSFFWWMRRREYAVPIGLGVSAVIYLLSLPIGDDLSGSTALMVLAPLAMLVAVRPPLEEIGPDPTPVSSVGPPERLRRLAPWLASPPSSSARRIRARRAGWATLAVAFIGIAGWSSFLALRDAPGPPSKRPHVFKAT